MAPSIAKVAAVALLVFFGETASNGGCGVSALDVAAGGPAAPPAPLVARLHLAFGDIDGAATPQQAADGEEGWVMECWSAVMELRSCTDEIVLFFLNGETYLDRDCCLAVRVLTRHCWPSMLAYIGFTGQEADILRGFCDAEVSAPPALPTPAPTSV